MSRFSVRHDAPPLRWWPKLVIVAGLVVTATILFVFPPRQRFAALGDFRLEKGHSIANASVGYRTMGQLNAAGTNAVLVAPWYQGTSGQVTWQIGPGKLVDSSRYFVVIVDTLGNGVSSSPSNSDRQPGAAFPVFTMRDVVESQYQVLTRTLQIRQLHAAVGISMGGMQVFQWTVEHPQFLKKAVAIVGSPRSQPDDRQRWEDGIEWWARPRWTRTREMLSQWRLRSALGELLLDPYDQTRQAEAIMTHDITRQFGGSLERAAAAMAAELMVISTRADREVNPTPAFDIAAVAAARLLELDGRCGHQAPSCERAVMWPAVDAFLSQ